MTSLSFKINLYELFLLKLNEWISYEIILKNNEYVIYMQIYVYIYVYSEYNLQ